MLAMRVLAGISNENELFSSSRRKGGTPQEKMTHGNYLPLAFNLWHDVASLDH
jgi:hypothetical protein